MASPSETHHPAITLGASPHDPSPPPPKPQQQQQEFPITRQSSIYFLTLDEFQHAVCEPGKNFGSMNMDEFLANIWNAEESQAVAAAMQEAALSEHPNGSAAPAGDRSLLPQSSLPRQSSLSVPAPLCRKTVEEVWSVIHKEQQQEQEQQQQQQQQLAECGSPGNATRQPTLGEMTLEDFLIKAGVVRERGGVSAALPSAHFPQQQPLQPPQHQQFGYFRNGNVEEREAGYGGFGYPDRRNTAGGGLAGGIPAYPVYPSQHLGGDGYAANGGGRSGSGFPGLCFGGRMGNGGMPGGFSGAQPLSPVSSDGVGPSQVVDNSVRQYGLEMRVGGARRRIVDGHPEKGLERRQRRMIKNRESAARSRARKQVCVGRLDSSIMHHSCSGENCGPTLTTSSVGRRQWIDLVGSTRSDQMLDRI